VKKKEKKKKGETYYVFCRLGRKRAFFAVVTGERGESWLSFKETRKKRKKKKKDWGPGSEECGGGGGKKRTELAGALATSYGKRGGGKKAQKAGERKDGPVRWREGTKPHAVAVLCKERGGGKRGSTTHPEPDKKEGGTILKGGRMASPTRKGEEVLDRFALSQVRRKKKL